RSYKRLKRETHENEGVIQKKLSFDRDVMWTSCPSVAASRKVTLILLIQPLHYLFTHSLETF
uniref:hypothetical protein n=1 Tax=Escherichia coli TaxID=562 RepID=UPI001B30148B